jgi:hypothetical protein
MANKGSNQPSNPSMSQTTANQMTPALVRKKPQLTVNKTTGKSSVKKRPNAQPGIPPPSSGGNSIRF